MRPETEDPTIEEVLRTEHRTVTTLLEELADTSEEDVEERERLFAEVRLNLELHTRAEEVVVYDLLRQHEETRALAEAAQREHKEVSRLLEAIAAMPVDDEEWTAKLAEMSADLVGHIEKEEGELFAALRTLLDGGQERTLAETFEAMKSRLERELAAA